MPDRIGGYDVIVAGAGHNSLIATAYLAKAGLRCLVLEERDVAGGNTATEELTLPGFSHDTCSTAHNLIQSSPTLRHNELHLDEYGLEYIHPDPVVHSPFPDGTSITMWRDLDRTVASFERLSPGDGATYRRMMDDYDRVKHIFSGVRYTPVGMGPTVGERLATHPEGAMWRRRIEESAWDVIDREFSHPNVKAFMTWMAFLTMQPPQRSGSGLLAYSLAFGRQQHSWVLPKGGSGALPHALVRLIEDYGGSVLTGRRVTSLVIEHGRCVGVEVESGEVFRAGKAVLSTIHVKHLIDMAPADAWDDVFKFGVDTWRPGISMMPTHYATTRPLRFDSADGEIEPVAAGISISTDRLLRVESDFLSGRVATEDPPVLALCPTSADRSRAPEGHHCVKLVGFQPYELPEGPEKWDELKDEVAEANLAQYRRYDPGLTDETILATKVKSPLDLERANAHNWHGSCHAGDQDRAQSGNLRPAPGWADHRMPIAGLYQTGATTHPGASVSGGPGRNAARVLLQDLGYDLSTVVGV